MLSIIVICINVFIVGNCRTETVIFTASQKLVKPQFAIFFQGVFIENHQQYLKNLKKLLFVSLQTKDFSQAYFSQENLPGNGLKLSFEAHHVPLSVGIATNVPNFENEVCFVTNGDENNLVQKMLKYLEDASNAAYEIMRRKFDCVFQALELSENVRKENLTKEFEAYCRELIYCWI